MALLYSIIVYGDCPNKMKFINEIYYFIKINMKVSIETGQISAGLDEVGRGCMMGRLYCGAVVFHPDEEGLDSRLVKDSKKFTSRVKRAEARDYILENCLDYSIAYCEPSEIDTFGLSKSWIKTMHSAIQQLDIDVEHLLIDGNYFESYQNKPHSCIIGGDAQYYPIAAASVIAKVAHDEYIAELVENYPILKEYGINQNMGYGTQQHMNAIQRLGLTEHHRKSFGSGSKSQKTYDYYLPIPNKCLL